jgi:hypothetical protein
MKNLVAEEISFVDVNPLDEPVNEKRYTQPNINTSGIDLNAPIDEPSFTPPPFKKTPPNAGPSGSGSKPGNSGSSGGGANNEENLSKKDLKVGAEAAADMAITTYEWLHIPMNKYLQISKKQVQRMVDAGELNLDAMIDYDANHRIRAEDFINQYNEQVSNLLTVSEEFKAELKPLLVELFMKKGVKISLETRIMIVIGKDMAGKVFLMFQQKQQGKLIMNSLAEATAKQMQPPPPPQPAPQPAPQPQPEPRPEPREKETIIVEPEEFEVDSKAVVVSSEKRKPKKYEI